MKHLAAASDMRGRGSRALEERANPDEVVMAPAKLEPDFERQMGREGFEPSTLGLRVDPAGFACSRPSSQGRITQRNQFCWGRAWWRNPVDLLLTHFVF